VLALVVRQYNTNLHQDCDEALKLNASYTKAVTRRGDCLLQLVRTQTLQGYLAHQKQPPPRTLQ